MKKLKPRPPLSALEVIHNCFNALCSKFRDIVCIECSWSGPTYYRKIRKPELLSNAELEKIRSVKDSVLREVTDNLNDLTYTIKPKTNT